jgi:glucose/arabinose dehydrogenase
VSSSETNSMFDCSLVVILIIFSSSFLILTISQSVTASSASGQTVEEKVNSVPFLLGNTNSANSTIDPVFDYNITSRHLYGCTFYEYHGYYCDPISNEFKSYAVLADYTKVASATREPTYIQAKYGKGILITGTHALESLRGDLLGEYNSSKFSIYVAVSPDNLNEFEGHPYRTLVAYKHGVYRDDLNRAGWIIETVPVNNSSVNNNTTKAVRFTVFDTNGNKVSPRDVNIPVDKISDIATTFDGRAVRIYLNGTLRSEVPFLGNYSGAVQVGSVEKQNNYFIVGGDAYCSCYLTSGIIDEVRYYNYSLTNQQIKQINSSPDILGKGLVGYWKFDGNLKDDSGLGNDLFYNTIIASMEFAPDGRLFFTEKNSGSIRVMMNDSVLPTPFATILNIHVDYEQGLLGLAIDPKFRENHFIYTYYNYEDEKTGNIYARLIRLIDDNNTGTDPVVLLDRIPAFKAGEHTGGALMFNPADDKLYITVGDAVNNWMAQNLSSLNGKVLRINRDGTIPSDNPFPNSPVFNYGHRNMYGIAFDDRGRGIVTEPGSASYDEINSVLKSGNYGWPSMPRPNNVPDPLTNDSSIKPLRSYYIPPNPTQAVYYNGDRFPEFKDSFIVGSFNGYLYIYKLSEDGKKLAREIQVRTAVYPSLEVVATAVSPKGEIYFGSYDIFKIKRIYNDSWSETMPIVKINSTNVKVSHLDYSNSKEELKINLQSAFGHGNLSVKIPKSLISQIPFNNSKSTNRLIESQIDYSVEVGKFNNYNTVNVEFESSPGKNLQMIINKQKFNLAIDAPTTR